MDLQSSDSEYDIYIPENPTTNLEVEEDAYEKLEYISLEWPSQTVSIKDNHIFIAPNSESDFHIMRITLEKINNNIVINEKFKIKKTLVKQNVNRIRCSNFLYAVSDNYILKFDFELNLIDSYDSQSLVKSDSNQENHEKVYNDNNNNKLLDDNKIGYGLIATNDACYFTLSGDLYILKEKPILIYKNLHEKEINDIKIINNFILTVSNDKKLHILNLNNKKIIKTIIFDSEINSITKNNENIVIGLDSGIISIYDYKIEDEFMINFKENISWHKSSISIVNFVNVDTLVTLSDEQVTLWDLNFEDEWQYHKYLHFVHAGQNYYKDVDVLDDMIVTTSLDGLCFFKPVGGI